ncbi:hypothetical protein JNUCC31_10135 [Paenibacillus sp. JNUCC31]|uniref:hypothetical protein n=1 Tax=Paenibacillus sp. JNUCC-31 TaxID=2777983 RepID=UPI001784B458|nr:hypothetical protein [Paenibacillus sp. JNUCC-31]QOS81175.1 hypothetical protein JNUCC31_10135 [Paenibacillus sp. JNUCC-31]
MSKKSGIIVTAIGAGVTYLMRNKQARDKLFTTVSGLMKSSSSSSSPSYGSQKGSRVDIK